jgi:hypothetical protein
MTYRFEVQGQRFGTMIFNTHPEAHRYLKHLLVMATDRYQAAAKRNKIEAKRLLEVRDRIVKNLRIVPASASEYAGQEVVLQKIEPNIFTDRISSKWRSYSEL